MSSCLTTFTQHLWLGVNWFTGGVLLSAHGSWKKVSFSVKERCGPCAWSISSTCFVKTLFVAAIGWINIIWTREQDVSLALLWSICYQWGGLKIRCLIFSDGCVWELCRRHGVVPVWEATLSVEGSQKPHGQSQAQGTKTSRGGSLYHHLRYASSSELSHGNPPVSRGLATKTGLVETKRRKRVPCSYTQDPQEG